MDTNLKALSLTDSFNRDHQDIEYAVEFSFRTTVADVLFITGESILGNAEYALGLDAAGALSVNVSGVPQRFFYADRIGGGDEQRVELRLNDAEWYRVRLTMSGGGRISIEVTIFVY